MIHWCDVEKIGKESRIVEQVSEDAPGVMVGTGNGHLLAYGCRPYSIFMGIN